MQVDNRYTRDRIVRTSYRVRLGTEWHLERAQARSEDSKRPNTSYVERLHLFQRRRCAYLNRRTPWPARSPRRLEESLSILRCVYNFCRPHSALRFGDVTRTPAMQAGLVTRPLSLREIFSWVPPPRRPERIHLWEIG